jgi:FkbH-like protein
MTSLSLPEIISLNKQLEKAVSKEPIFEVKILSNIITYPIKDYLENVLLNLSIYPKVTFGDYDNIVQESAQSTSQNVVIVFWELMNLVPGFHQKCNILSEEDIQAILQKVKSEIDITINALKNNSCVIFNKFSDLLFTSHQIKENPLEKVCNELNHYLESALPNTFFLIELDKVIAVTGISGSFQPRFLYSSSAPYTTDFYYNYTQFIQPIVRSLLGKSKKALLLDCDNTLWKGVIGEDGMEGIKMSENDKQGVFFHEVQQIAIALFKQGIILGLCSKNNLQDVQEVLDNHQDVVLKDEYITIKKVNWEDKATNIRAIAKELNIGLDSLVFMDDSDFEVNLIREQLPEVTVLHVPKKLYEYPGYVSANLGLFFHASSTKEDLDKAKMYKENFQREDAKKQFDGIEDYLQSLEIELIIYKNDLSKVDRMAQMTQKTNQFNLTTHRYSESDMIRFIEKENKDLYCFEVRDKFGSAGITGLAILEYPTETAAHVNSFLMSCRVLGRNIEIAFMDFILNTLQSNGTKKVSANFIKTYKNSQVAQFYDKFNFEIIESNEVEKSYELFLENYKTQELNYIKIENGK